MKEHNQIRINLKNLKKRSPNIVLTDNMFFTEELSFIEYLKQILEQAKEREQIKNVVLSKVGDRFQVIFEEVK